jgi:hypothetical protein
MKRQSVEVLCVRTAPEDAATDGRLAGACRTMWRSIPDRTLERGSIILDTKRGHIDASVQTQLAEVKPLPTHCRERTK